MKGLIFIVLGCLALSAQAASFDCGKASTHIEKLICSDPDLSKLDEKLGEDYQGALGKADEEQKQLLLTEQRHWLKHTRNVCQDITCLKLAYWSRQAELETYFEPKARLYKHEADKAEAIKEILATAPLNLLGMPSNGVPNYCTRMLDDLKQMKGIRFIDPVVQTQSYEDPALDKWKTQCKGKPSLNFSRWCLPNIAANLSAGREGFAESLALCGVGFGLPPFKIYELPPIDATEKVHFVFYADDAYGPMNLKWEKSILGGGFSGFREIDPKECEQVEDVFAQANRGARDSENYNSIIEYKNQYYFLVLNKQVDSWWLDLGTVTPNGAKNQKDCFWSPVIPASPTSNQGSK